MSQEELLLRVERLERSVRWRTRLLTAVAAIAVLGAASASSPTSLVIGKEGGPTVTIEDGVLRLTSQSGHTATLAPHELVLSANDHSSSLTAEQLEVFTTNPGFWDGKVTVSTSGLLVDAKDTSTSVGKFFVQVAGAGTKLELGVTPEGAQSPPGDAYLKLVAGPKQKGGVIRLDAPQGRAPVISLAPSESAPPITLSTDGKITRSAKR